MINKYIISIYQYIQQYIQQSNTIQSNPMLTPKLVAFYLVIILAGVAYSRYKKSQEGNNISDGYNLIKKYLYFER